MSREPKKIYTILTMTNLEQGEHKFLNFGSERLVGWYSDKNDAFDAVMENACDINETCYDYALIEEIEEGLYRSAISGSRWFFKYNRDTRGYEQIEEPDFVKSYCGFTIG